MATWRVNTRLYCDKFTMRPDIFLPFPPSFSRSEKERDPTKKSDRRATPCIFDGTPIVGYPGALSIDRSRFSRVKDGTYTPLVFSGGLKTSLGSSAFTGGAGDIQRWNPWVWFTANGKNLCVCVCVNLCVRYVWACACLKLVALAGPMGAGDAKNPGTKEWKDPSNCFHSLDSISLCTSWMLSRAFFTYFVQETFPFNA